MRPLERARDEALAALRRRTIKPLVEQGLDGLRQGLRKQIKDGAKLSQWLERVERALLEHIDLFEPLHDQEPDSDAEPARH